MFKGPDADRFCDRGTKRDADNSWYCCPKACGGQCLASSGDCAESLKHKSDTFNPSCCIPLFTKAKGAEASCSSSDDTACAMYKKAFAAADGGAKECTASSAPCKMEKQWTDAEKADYRAAQFAKATNQDVKKFKENNKAVAKQRAMLDGYEGFVESSKPYTSAEAKNANAMSGFQNSMDGCNNLFRQKTNENMRADCLNGDTGYTGDSSVHGLHADHDYTKKRVGRNSFADFYFAHNNKKSANAFAGCVAGKAAEVCKKGADYTAYGQANEEDCRYCLDFQ